MMVSLLPVLYCSIFFNYLFVGFVVDLCSLWLFFNFLKKSFSNTVQSQNQYCTRALFGCHFSPWGETKYCYLACFIIKLLCIQICTLHLIWCIFSVFITYFQCSLSFWLILYEKNHYCSKQPLVSFVYILRSAFSWCSQLAKLIV